MARTTRKDLERLLKSVSDLQNRPHTSWERDAEGNNRANVGALQLDHNSIYGGWDLVEIVNESGGENSLIGNTFAGRGRLSAHEMESFLLGILTGIQGTQYWPKKDAE